ncbi:hypothetical protein [Celeribacter ethanolicus]|uniref:hypothetical protein n=1 Tax=Celeribacter ethanolicus TaxID=1758178 RepID=UPI0008374236|nr:hypothetical protein [Celeribacter ethanolicus]
MSVWLDAARQGPGAMTKLTKPTKLKSGRAAGPGVPGEVLSVKSVLSEGVRLAPSDQFDLWEEGAAILQFDAGMSRERAESEAARRLGLSLFDMQTLVESAAKAN